MPVEDRLGTDQTAEGSVLVFPWQAGEDPAPLLSREWLVTNGLGGYASGTVGGVATRRYHGLLIPNLPAPRGRTVLIPCLDESAQVGQRTVLLSGVEFADSRLEGDMFQFLQEFRLEWQVPTWEFGVDGHWLTKRLAMPYGQNTVCAEYRPSSGGPIRLLLRPFLTFRMHDEALGVSSEWPFTLAITRERYEVHPFAGAPPLRMGLRPQGGVFVADATVSQGVFYRVERDRGYDHVEDLFSPGYFMVDLGPEQAISFVASTEGWELLEFEAQAIFEAEQQRLEKLLVRAPELARAGFAAQLVLAADQFVILPGSRLEENVLARAAGTEARTVVAGYHWFTDWGRDTMISLEGLTLCTGRYGEARRSCRRSPTM